MLDSGQAFDLLEDAIKKARAHGAEAAEASLGQGLSLSVVHRLGKLESLDRADGAELSLRVFIGNRVALIASSDIKPESLDGLAEQAVAMARAVPEDPYAGLADPGQLATETPDLDLCDPAEPASETLVEMARNAEDSALSVAGVTNSEGAEASWGRSRIAIVGTNGLRIEKDSSMASLSVSVLAGDPAAGMERDYDYSTAVFLSDLRDGADIGKRAAEMAVRRLGARKVKTRQVPVVFDARPARSLLGHLSGAINGASVARGTSFLKDKRGEQVFGAGIVIIDDPFRRRGLRSRAVDGEGLAPSRQALIDNGVLTGWILDLAAARQLGLPPTGHAGRSGGSPSASPSNLYLAAGDLSRDALLADIDSGFYVTDLVGMGVNGVTGDYSRGAAGFWIENGELAYPVNEVTIAGNLKDMFRHLTPASDLEFRYGMDSPTVRVDGMTVAGN